MKIKQKIKNKIHLVQSVWANWQNQFPAKKLTIIGVTGSDGKTTTTSLIYHLLKTAGKKVGYISTVEARIGDKVLDTGLHVTTPDPWMVPKYLKMMVDEKLEYVVLESTSSGLDQNRLWGIEFDTAVITNIREDHLDYHGTWQNYAKAKFKLLEQTKANGKIILNRDDEQSYNWLIAQIKSKDITADIEICQKSEAANLAQSPSGMEFVLDGQKYNAPLIGEYNLENILQAIKACRGYLSKEQIAEALKTFRAPKGRMEIVKSSPTVIIDFAHTPNSLERALSAVREVMQPKSKLICVFGCAGKRDKNRRKMGEVSARLADITVLTAEDPRDEDLAKINDEIITHAKNAGGHLVARFTNSTDAANFRLSDLKPKSVFAFDENSPQSRIDAIGFASKLTGKNDVLFVTGKAHEQSLAFGNPEVEYPWSDHDVVKKAFGEL